MSKNTSQNRRPDYEQLPQSEVRAIIAEIKREMEEEFQEKLKHMTPEEREKAIAMANALF